MLTLTINGINLTLTSDAEFEYRSTMANPNNYMSALAVDEKNVIYKVWWYFTDKNLEKNQEDLCGLDYCNLNDIDVEVWNY